MSEIASSLQRVGVVERGFEARGTSIRPRPRLLTFGVFELDSLTGELRRDGRLVHLRHQPATVLRLLLERTGDLVTRREITEALWPDDVDVDVEQGLNHCMKEIRAALGDRPASPRFIQTLPRRGYRFLVEVYVNGRELGSLALDPPEPDPPPPSAAPAPKARPDDPEADPGLGDGRFE
jgi:DNA-binding winged helix-turn-helix (wHTH) protein